MTAWGSIPLAVPMLPVKRAKGIFWLFDKHHNTSAGNQESTYYYPQTDRFAQEQERQADGHDHTELVYRSHTRYISGLQCLEIKQPRQSRCYSRKDEEYPRMFAYLPDAAVSRLQKTIPHVMHRMIVVRIAVARSELMSFTPILAKIAVSAAKNADSSA